MPKQQISEKDATQLLKQLQSLNSTAKGIKQNANVKSTASQIDKEGAQLCKDNKDMPDA